jgi:transposase
MQTKRYPNDLTDAPWFTIAPVLLRVVRTDGRRSVDLQEVPNAIRYLARSGVGRRILPKDFPTWKTV